MDGEKIITKIFTRVFGIFGILKVRLSCKYRVSLKSAKLLPFSMQIPTPVLQNVHYSEKHKRLYAYHL